MSSSEASRAKLPFGQMLIYGCGQMGHQVFDSGIGYLAFYVFNISLGVNPVLVGLAQAACRGVDLITDPLAGYLTDSLRNRVNPRILISIGTVVGGVFFAAIWLFPSGLTPFGYFLWLLACFSITSAAWSFCSVPRQALGIEMTDDPDDRAKLMATAWLMANLCNLGLCWSYAATQLPFFGGTVNGARWVGGAMGLAIILFTFVFVLFYREGNTVPRSAPARARVAGFRDFLVANKRVVRCRPFVLLAAVVALVIIGMISTAYGINHCVVIYYLCGGSQPHASVIMGGGSTAWILAGFAATPPALGLSRRIGKKGALMVFLSLVILGAGLKWFCYNPAWPWLYVIPHALFGAGIGALAALAPSMTADLCDLEESLSGEQDSGVFSAFYNWSIKLGIGVSIAISGVLLNLTGFSTLKGVNQGAGTILSMRLVDIIFPAVLIAVSIGLLAFYPVTSKQMEAVRAARKRAIASPEIIPNSD